MAIEVVTKEDLEQFRMQLLADLKEIMHLTEGKLIKPWLKNSEVRKLLNISSNTLQRLRIAGTLHPKKVGGIHFYRYEEIQRLMNNDAA